ncbi:MAG: nucleotidyltransferase family protein, partial [bacterium]
LESLLYSEWNTNACHKVAPERLQRLKNSARIAAFNEALKEKRLLEVLSNLAQAGVEPLLIKGSALAYFVYDAPHHRFRNDTDLMIPMSAISRARGVLESLGYRVDGPMYKSHQYTAVDTRAVHGSEQNLDIHWRISNHSRFARVLEYTECLTRAELIDIGGTRVKGLGAVDSL